MHNYSSIVFLFYCFSLAAQTQTSTLNVRKELQYIPFNSFQGFGSISIVNYTSQIIVKSQRQFQDALTSNTLITISPNLRLSLTQNIMLANVHNLYINGENSQISMFGIYIENCSNIVLYNIRITNASYYGVLIKQSSQIIVDHCTILDASRNSVQEGKGIDLTQASSNIIFSWNIIGYTYPISQLIKFKGILIANFKDISVTNVSIHHNVFYCNYQRSPQISTEGLFDMRNNIIFNYTQYGTRVRQNAYGNFIQNWYMGGKKDPLIFLTKLNIYSQKNTWKFQNRQTIDIEEIKTSQQFKTPKITEKTFIQTLNGAGCVQKGIVEKIILKNVYDMLKSQPQYLRL